MRPSPAQIESYRSNGFLVVENVLTPARVAEGRRIIDEFVERARGVAAGDAVYDLEPDHSAERPLVRRLKSPHQQHPFFFDLIRSDEVLDLLEGLIGQGVRLGGSKLNMKAANAGSPVEWHQDFAFHPHTNDDVFAIGFYFDDATVENGCMLMIPGAHKGPIYDHHQDGFFVGAIAPGRGEVDLTKAVPIEVPAGGISIHHGHMLHASAPNRSSRPRRLLLFDMMGVDAWPIMGVKDLDAYNKLILRGQPTLQVRLAPVSARIPLPRPPRSATIYEMQEQARDTTYLRR